MRRILMIVMILFCSLCTVTAENTTVKYSIHCDSKKHEEWELKHQILQVYDELNEGVEKGSRAVMVRGSTDRFILDDQTEVSYGNNELRIIHGDGKGSLIQGSFEDYRCVGSVQKKSLIEEIIKELNK